jgi:hypothetical protein
LAAFQLYPHLILTSNGANSTLERGDDYYEHNEANLPYKHQTKRARPYCASIDGHTSERSLGHVLCLHVYQKLHKPNFRYPQLPHDCRVSPTSLSLVAVVVVDPALPSNDLLDSSLEDALLEPPGQVNTLLEQVVLRFILNLRPNTRNTRCRQPTRH